MLDATQDAPQNDTKTDLRSNKPIITVENVDFWYGQKQALKSINMEVFPREVLAFMGPSGCGKSTLLKLLNRMQDEVPGARMTGRITLDGEDIHDPRHDPVMIRRRFGWVAQSPNPFPKTVRENIAYGPRIHALVADGPDMDAHVENCLRRAMLWDEMKNRLDEPGTQLSGGQQQRLCIARALSINPDVLLMDEPCSAIDPIASAAIEALIHELRKTVSIIIITHNLQQAQRLADRVAFFHLGDLVEYGTADRVFGAPTHLITKSYLDGVFG